MYWEGLLISAVAEGESRIAEGESRIVAGENEDKQATFAEKVGIFFCGFILKKIRFPSHKTCLCDLWEPSVCQPAFAGHAGVSSSQALCKAGFLCHIKL